MIIFAIWSLFGLKSSWLVIEATGYYGRNRLEGVYISLKFVIGVIILVRRDNKLQNFSSREMHMRLNFLFINFWHILRINELWWPFEFALCRRQLRLAVGGICGILWHDFEGIICVTFCSIIPHFGTVRFFRFNSTFLNFWLNFCTVMSSVKRKFG